MDGCGTMCDQSVQKESETEKDNGNEDSETNDSIGLGVTKMESYRQME